MEELNIITRTYKNGNYVCDIVIENTGDGHINTDVWLGKEHGAVKMYMFNLQDKTLDDVIKIVNEAIVKDDTYTSAIDEMDIYER